MEEPGFKEGLAYLSQIDGDYAHALTLISPIPSRSKPPGFKSLTRIIIEQQVSLASAAAIWSRMENAISPFSADRLLTFSEEQLRSLGLSRPKAIYCHALANDIKTGKISLSSLSAHNNDEIHEILTSVKGIGRWTAEIYMIACLGRQDIWPAGDVALRIALQHLKGWDDRPTLDEMDAHSEPLSPYRTLAARILWRYYADIVQNKNNRNKQKTKII